MVKIQLLSLKTFSATGGIEKLSRIIGKLLVDEYADSKQVKITSLYDDNATASSPYFDKKYFTGLGGKKLSWLLWLMVSRRRTDLLIVTHSNILPMVRWLKKINKNCKVILVAHGIEVWKPVKNIELVDHIVAVSNFTATALSRENNIPTAKMTVINNCIDPYLEKLGDDSERDKLRTTNKIGLDKFVFVSVTRLAATERHKGYDKVIRILGKIKREQGLHIHYVIAGKYTAEEETFIKQVASDADMQGFIHLPGFVLDQELKAYFEMSDAYILPSKKEGFGITFIEAMHYGLPVIAGNKDGSVDALLNGALGILINPDEEKEIEEAILKLISRPEDFVPDAALVEQHFSYESYKHKWLSLLG